MSHLSSLLPRSYIRVLMSKQTFIWYKMDVLTGLGYDYIDKFTIISGGSFLTSKRVEDWSVYWKKLWLCYSYLGDVTFFLYMASLTVFLFTFQGPEVIFILAIICYVYLTQIIMKVVIFRLKSKEFQQVFDDTLVNSLELHQYDDSFMVLYKKYFKRLQYLINVKGSLEQINLFVVYFPLLFASPEERILPFPEWLPFDISSNAFYFHLASFLQYFAFVEGQVRHLYVDTLCLKTLLAGIVQLKFLKPLLGEVMGEDDEASTRKLTFKKWIGIHQNITGVMEKFKPVFSLYLGVSYTILFLILFLGGLVMTQDSALGVFQKFIITLNILNNVMMMYVVSAVADTLHSTGLSVADEGTFGAMNSKSKSIKSKFLFVMARAKKPIVFRIVSWKRLSSQNCLAAVKATVTYFITVLQIKARG